jgi:hypothetical protein
MATELRDVPGTDISQTRFAGGKDRGAMLQLTVQDRGSFQTIQLTREESLSLAQELILFANGQEKHEVHLENFQRSFLEMSE